MEMDAEVSGRGLF